MTDILCAYGGCNKTISERNSYCIFHDPDMWRKCPDELKYEFRQLLTRGENDFAGFNFPSINMSNYPFEKPTYFRDAIFHGGIIFTATTINKEINFNGAIFEDMVNFRDSKIDKPGIIDFSNARFFNVLDLKGVDLSKIMFSGIDITNARLIADFPNDYKIRDELIARNSRGLTKRDLLLKLSKTYKSLKSAVLNEGNYEDAGELYYREMVCKKDAHKAAFLFYIQKLFKNKKGEEISFWKEFGSWTTASFFNTICGFGERVKRIILFSFGIILTFSILYFFILDLPQKYTNNDVIMNFLDALYLSLDSFTTLGTANYVCLGNFKWLAQFESLLGVIMVSLFLVVFVRKMTRN